MGPPLGTLLCVCNYPANTGYAWDFIESLYAGVATRLAARGIRTLVAYPTVERPPRTLDGSPASAVELDARLRTWASLRATIQFVRHEAVTVVYLTDYPPWAAAYAGLRMAGVRAIISHDHSSGERSVPAGIRRALKWAAARAPLIQVDRLIAVSDYVAKRHERTGLIPASRIVRVWNGVTVPPATDTALRPLHRALSIEENRPAIACACRAAPEKGVLHLLAAFDLLLQSWPSEQQRPILVYMGDGPQLPAIREFRERLTARDDILLTGYRNDAGALTAGADVCVMPSVWQDALPLAVMQPMALGRPVIASAVGGIPEMIVDGHTGLLVPPADERALASAIARLLNDPGLATRLGTAARARVAALFTTSGQIDALAAIVGRGFGINLNGTGAP